MKSILMPVRPKWVAKILNGEKTIELRKTAPKCKLPIGVYIYCTKGKPYLAYEKHTRKYVLCDTIEELGEYGNEVSPTNNACALQDWGVATNGHIVAKFTLDNVEEIELPYTKFGCEEWVGCEEERTLQTKSMCQEELLKKGCLSEDEIYGYLNFKNKHYGYAWHISDLMLFDEPAELNEFYSTRLDKDVTKLLDNSIQLSNGKWVKRLDKAPQSWCYVEEKEDAK